MRSSGVPDHTHPWRLDWKDGRNEIHSRTAVAGLILLPSIAAARPGHKHKPTSNTSLTRHDADGVPVTVVMVMPTETPEQRERLLNQLRPEDRELVLKLHAELSPIHRRQDDRIPDRVRRAVAPRHKAGEHGPQHGGGSGASRI